MSCQFRLGQQVVCVNADKDGPGIWLGDPPVVGAVYTIRAMRPTSAKVEGEPLVWLYFEEIHRLAIWPYGELGYWHTRFRPLETRKRETDISVFREILDKARKGQLEPV